MIVEIRTYLLKPSSGEEFARLMREEVLPLLARHGVTVVDSDLSLATEDGAEHAYLVRAFQSLADREAQEDAFYASQDWQAGPRQAILARIQQHHTVVLEVPDAVVRQWRKWGRTAVGREELT